VNSDVFYGGLGFDIVYIQTRLLRADQLKEVLGKTQ
jgi:hypothetical protein